jgi:hypothetical protein
MTPFGVQLLDEGHDNTGCDRHFQQGHGALGVIGEELLQSDEQQRDPGAEVLEPADPGANATPVVVEINGQGSQYTRI